MVRRPVVKMQCYLTFISYNNDNAAFMLRISCNPYLELKNAMLFSTVQILFTDL